MRLACIASGLLVVGCQAMPTAPTPASSPADGGPAVSLYQYAGSRQCERGGKPIDALRRELAAAGVQVREASCGHDGRMYAQSCGTADGRILVVQVPQGQAARAARLGLKPLRELPEAVTLACR